MLPWAIRSDDVRPAGMGAALASATVARSGAAAREGGGTVLALAVPAGSTGALCSLMATLLPFYRRAPYPLQDAGLGVGTGMLQARKRVSIKVRWPTLLGRP